MGEILDQFVIELKNLAKFLGIEVVEAHNPPMNVDITPQGKEPLPTTLMSNPPTSDQVYGITQRNIERSHLKTNRIGETRT